MPKLLTVALLVITAALFSITATGDQARDMVLEKVKGKCALKFPTDDDARGYCFKQQSRAIDEFVLLRSRYPKGSDGFEILLRCFSRWSQDGFTDWENVVYCTQEQVKGYRSLD